ncbi:hypothetical protein DICVIV_06544 [Dictyocaulus viviparus]|uniref:G-protein coupled receptors family 1 profile domain-containing protein n=1 Tax=Dictyocaulus viviparus TaxID=29172 RepID=A0A0D8XYE8_DICVI|nr:hypothetical protein DICVIV_06544 [Dictyocaulus viviparus]
MGTPVEIIVISIFRYFCKVQNYANVATYCYRINSSRFRRALLLLMILVLTYAICWAPMNIHNALNSFEVISYSQYRYLFCHLVGISSACVNPITYALVNESFRNALHHMFLSFRPCYVTSGESASSYITNSKPPKITIPDQCSTKFESPTNNDEMVALRSSAF